jgi:hypothetical protein
VRAISEGRIPYMNWGRRGFDDMRERMGRGLRGMGPKVSVFMGGQRKVEWLAEGQAVAQCGEVGNRVSWETLV